ncbi:MAG TPA: phosphotransferase [Steroidobacteraceae bacterium]|nr:phosphotransferase [Steroidobacteraceae bacterium]
MSEADVRLQRLTHWLQHQLGWPLQRLEVASADASFRRYFRAFDLQGATRVVMDAPPDKEDIAPYLAVARLLEACGVHVPHVEAVDSAQGFVLMEDLGSTQLLGALRSGGDVEQLYRSALDELLLIQVGGLRQHQHLPPYDAAVLERELQLMPEWFLARHLGLTPDAGEQRLLTDTFAQLIAAALAQPRVLVHRDYHSRNLMTSPSNRPGIIDFQDALSGPVGYDLVSLLKDCYIHWPRQRVVHWVFEYRARLIAAGAAQLAGGSDSEFLRWFDWIGLQRHLKVLGIFARLSYRDGKHGYLDDLPLTLYYVRDTAARYGELHDFRRWLEARVVPAFQALP